MKNLLNYLNDYFDENIEEQLCNKKLHVSKDKANEWQLKANRKASRDEEIEKYGKPLNHSRIYRDKTKYTRKSKHKNNNY